ncbi:MAG: hypothetical protein HC875_37890 [Anaerolineales bacterium]|nr:hypothetical protein [Anaerolineales bacterium]
MHGEVGDHVHVALEQAVEDHQRPPAKQGGLFAIQGGDNAKPAMEPDKATLWREADSLNACGMKWEAIARQWNEQGRRTGNGAEYRGANIAREVRKWKEGGDN